MATLGSSWVQLPHGRSLPLSLSSSSSTGLELAHPRAAGSCFLCGRLRARESTSAFQPSLFSKASTGYTRSIAMAAASQSTQSVSEDETKIGKPGRSQSPLQLTYLEGNSWLWEVTGLQILVDPVLVGNLDFGIPWLYDAGKKLLKEFTLDDLPELDCILITQSYDDHCHKRTLEPLSKMFPNVHVIATPNAESLLSKLGFKHVTYLAPRHSTTLGDVRIRATEGPVLGPPWQRPENGYFLEVPEPKFVLYYEPHCIYKKAKLDQEHADVVITPVNKQVLPAYTLVSGQEDAVQLAKFLQPKYLVTMKNAELDSRGLLSMLVSERGTVQAFKDMLSKEVPNVQVLEPEPGVPLMVPIKS